MVTTSKLLGCMAVLLLSDASWSHAQTSLSAPVTSASPAALTQAVNPTANAGDNASVLLAQASAPAAPAAAKTTTPTPSGSSAPAAIEPENLTENGGVGVREFQG